MYESDDDLYDDIFEVLRNEQWLMGQLNQQLKETGIQYDRGENTGHYPEIL
jgi:hypothetical protein